MEINIKKIRMRKNVTASYICSKTGIDKSRFSRIEDKHPIYCPTIKELQLIAEVLNVKVIDLFDCDNKM